MIASCRDSYGVPSVLEGKTNRVFKYLHPGDQTNKRAKRNHTYLAAESFVGKSLTVIQPHVKQTVLFR